MNHHWILSCSPHAKLFFRTNTSLCFHRELAILTFCGLVLGYMNHHPMFFPPYRNLMQTVPQKFEFLARKSHLEVIAGGSVHPICYIPKNSLIWHDSVFKKCPMAGIPWAPRWYHVTRAFRPKTESSPYLRIRQGTTLSVPYPKVTWPFCSSWCCARSLGKTKV